MPVDAVQIAIAEQRTLVMHNLELYWPPIGQLIRHVVRFFHAYTQVNLYMSPPHLPIATAPHQDAHSVFIVQTHGRKRWCVHAPKAPWTIKALQRGKHGEVISPSDRSLMGPPLLNVTLRPGQVLYIPRAFFHHTSTDAAVLLADDVNAGAAGSASDDDDALLDGQPSMALTVSILNEDVFGTWVHLLGEAVQGAPALSRGGEAHERDADRVVRALRRAAADTSSGEVGAQLREGLPRAVAVRCGAADQAVFTNGRTDNTWHDHALRLLEDAVRGHSGPGDDVRPHASLPRWLQSRDNDAPLLASLEAVLRRKRVPCTAKLAQIEAMQDALRTRNLPLTGAAVDDIDVDQIFFIEKQDKSYIPADRAWFTPRDWLQ